MQERAQQSRENILKAAEKQFADLGFYGARVDDIARNSGINKALIYKYFGNKKELYRIVFKNVYDRFTLLEQSVLELENLSYEDKIRRFVEMEYYFCLKNESYVRMIMWENLNSGNDVSLSVSRASKQPILNLLKNILRQAEVDIDEYDFLITVYSLCFFYFTNMNTMNIITNRNLAGEANIKHRVDVVSDILITYINEHRKYE